MSWEHVIAWGIFLAIVLLLLAVDLFVLHRKPREIRLKEAFLGTLVPVIAATLFCGALWYAYNTHFLDLGVHAQHNLTPSRARLYPTDGNSAVILFATGYLVELSLSADNVFLFVILMSFFRVPRELQHRVLFWGVTGALVMRGIMILMGTALLTQFHWIVYIFGAFLIIAGFRMMFAKPKDPSDNLAVRIMRKTFPIKEGYEGKKFFTRVNGKRAATTLFLVLVCIEFTDLVFALDSIPAIFGITQDAYIVFTSNVFAILGLRSMYFLLAGVMDRFHLLKYGLALVLGFVGVKMLLPAAEALYSRMTGTPNTETWDVSPYISLAIVIGILAASIIASLLIPSKEHHDNPMGDSLPQPPHAGPRPSVPVRG